jgi:hypothetical protein
LNPPGIEKKRKEKKEKRKKGAYSEITVTFIGKPKFISTFYEKRSS